MCSLLISVQRQQVFESGTKREGRVGSLLRYNVSSFCVCECVHLNFWGFRIWISAFGGWLDGQQLPMCPRWQVRSHTSDPSCSYLLICVGTNQNTRGSCGSIKLKTGSSKRAWLYGNLSSNLKLNTDVWRICTHNQYLGIGICFGPHIS